jgi:hypothetical protein
MTRPYNPANLKLRGNKARRNQRHWVVYLVFDPL